VKVRPYYDRSDLVQVTIDTVEHNLLLGMALVLIVLIFFLVSVRAAIIVALTIPLSLLFAFIFLHARGIPANLLSIGAIDFGIIIDGTVVMMENIYRELAARHGQEYKLHEVIIAAAHDVDRPIFYSIAVILAGYIPIYALSGPSGKLFHPMAETMSWALLGSLIFTLTLVPVLASYWFTNGVKEKTNRAYEWFKREYAAELRWCLDRPNLTMVLATSFSAHRLLLIPFIGGEFMPHLDEGAMWVRATMPYTISFEEAAKFAPQIRKILMAYPHGHRGRLGAGPPRRRHRSHRIFQLRVLRRAETLQRRNLEQGSIHNKAELTKDIQKKVEAISRSDFQLHAARRRRRG
jgi:heavy metal efflux system protein